MKEKTKKPRYRLGQNMLWMLRQAHAAHRDDVQVFAVIKALAMAGTGISGLLLGGQRLSGARADVRASRCAPCAHPQDPL